MYYLRWEARILGFRVRWSMGRIGGKAWSRLQLILCWVLLGSWAGRWAGRGRRGDFSEMSGHDETCDNVYMILGLGR